jgi:hypothetical protein
MTIAYLVYWNNTTASGVWNKIVSQLQCWHSLGHAPALFLLQRTHASPPQLGSIPIFHRTFATQRERVIAYSTLVKEILSYKPDVVYTRYDLFQPSFLRLARALPTVVEVNTKDTAEYFHAGPLRGVYNLLTRHWIFKYAAGFVTVTNELRDWLRAQLPADQPVQVISNGIPLGSYPVLPPHHGPRPRLVFLGTPGCSWHGLDRVCDLAVSWPEAEFHIVGPPKEALPHRPRNVVIHGPLHPTHYRTLLSQADVAIGTLALYRKRMQEASPLKTREYLAYGLPVVIAYVDTDFPSGAPFLFSVPNTPAPLSPYSAAIKAFCNSWKGRRVPRDLIAHIDASAKEKERLLFLSRLSKTCVTRNLVRSE